MALTASSPSKLLAIATVAAGVAWLAFADRTAGVAPTVPPTPNAPAGQPGGKEADDRATDRAAVLAAVDALAKAFSKGDAKAVAARWTPEGEYTDDAGVTFRSRPALEKAYAEFFAKHPDNALEVEVELVRFPSRDTAVVEGHFKVHKGKKKELVVSRCSLLYAREDGKWLIAIAREWPGDGISLRDLEWLIGTWEAKRDGTIVSTRYEWTANKSFIRCKFSITQDGKSHAGMQMFGKDPATGALRVWTFEDTGGIGDTEIIRDGKKWVFNATGATPDGRVITAINIMTPIDANSFLWHSVERSLDGEELPDLAPVKVTRVKVKP